MNAAEAVTETTNVFTVQLDPLAAILSAVAVIVSIWAIRVAKREPVKARAQANRDVVRESLRDAEKGLKTVMDLIRSGENVGEPVASIAEATATARAVGPRLEERSEVQLLEVRLMGARSNWLTLHREEQRIAWVRENAVPGTPVEHIVQTNLDRRAALRLELTTEAETVRSEIKKYIAKVDAAERNGK